MSTFVKIEEIKSWQESIELVEEVYRIINSSNNLVRDFSLKEQMQKSVISIPSNIAEGFERKSSQEFIRFLYIAKGSCGELRTQVYIALKLRYISNNEFLALDDKSRNISGMIMNLIKTLKHSL